MDRESLVQLTNNLYRLTLLFPRKEPLRYKIRELANDILAKCLRINFDLEQDKNLSKKLGESGSPQVFKDLEVLDGFFEVALIQNWVSPSEILAIKREYDNLKNEINKLIIEEKEKKGPKAKDRIEETSLSVSRSELAEKINLAGNQKFPSKLNQRQEKILDFLRQSGRAQVWQIKKIMPEVTKRTLRRDFEQMMQQGIIERRGEKNETFYQIKTPTPNQD